MKKKTVMIVDDERLLRETVKKVLEKEGYFVVTASSSEEALEILRQTKPNLILLDFFMPGMSGRELCEKIRADNELKDLKIIFLTVANISAEGMKTLKKMDVLDYIKKPFDNQDLIQRIKKII